MRGDSEAPELVKASLASVESAETVEVLWNPASYRVRRENALEAPPAIGEARASPLHLAGGGAWFETELFVDTTDRPHGAQRDARRCLGRLADWMRPSTPSFVAPRVVFVWGPFRFAGSIERLEEEWLEFDPDGTPVRAWIRLTLRGEG